MTLRRKIQIGAVSVFFMLVSFFVQSPPVAGNGDTMALLVKTFRPTLRPLCMINYPIQIGKPVVEPNDPFLKRFCFYQLPKDGE